MPGGGTPALAPIKAPGLVDADGPSYAFAGETANAARPAAKRRALLINLIGPPSGNVKRESLPILWSLQASSAKESAAGQTQDAYLFNEDCLAWTKRQFK